MSRRSIALQPDLPFSPTRSASGCGDRPDLPASWRWSCPTFGEFVSQIEREFGEATDLSSLTSTGLGRDERLPPEAVRALCEQIGLPPEDFGVQG